MRTVRVIAVLGLLAMTSAIAFGFANGGFFDEGAAIWALAWGKVTLIDLYVGIVFFGGWIALRESSALRIAAWWVGLALLGNLTAAIYLVIASFTSRSLHQLMVGEPS